MKKCLNFTKFRLFQTFFHWLEEVHFNRFWENNSFSHPKINKSQKSVRSALQKCYSKWKPVRIHQTPIEDKSSDI